MLFLLIAFTNLCLASGVDDDIIEVWNSDPIGGLDDDNIDVDLGNNSGEPVEPEVEVLDVDIDEVNIEIN